MGQAGGTVLPAAADVGELAEDRRPIAAGCTQTSQESFRSLALAAGELAFRKLAIPGGAPGCLQSGEVQDYARNGSQACAYLARAGSGQEHRPENKAYRDWWARVVNEESTTQGGRLRVCAYRADN